MAKPQDDQQQQNMLDVELVPKDDQVKIRMSNFRIALEKTQPDPIYKVSKAQVFKIDDQDFEVNSDLLRNALRITPKVSDHPFTLPALEKEIIAFINELGCSKNIRIISALRTNDMYQPWRTL
ncbi:hypothetical protein Tco_0867351 [Tanacetum coccineum]